MAEPWGLLIGVSVVVGAWLGPVAAIPLLWLVLVFQFLRGRWQLLPLALVIVALAVGVIRASTQTELILPPGAADTTIAIGEISSMTRNSATGGSVLLLVDQVEPSTAISGNFESFPIWLTLPEGANVSRGDRVTVRWSLTPLAEVTPGFASWVQAQGAVGTAYAWNLDIVESGQPFYRFVEDLRDDISLGLMEVLPGDRGALASGIVTGDDSALSGSAKEAFRLTGTTHITAVSGTNVAMVVALWAALVPANRRRRLLLVQLLIVTSVWLYALLTGLEPPATRAATMATLILLGSRFGRRPDAMTLLALTSAGMVLWNPRNVEMTAFWLSVVATAAIITRIPQEADAGWKRQTRGMVEGVLLAQLATLPVVVNSFDTWSLISVLANIVLAPLMWAAFPLSFLLGGLVLVGQPVAIVFAWLPGMFLTLCLQVVEDLSRLVPEITVDHAGWAGYLLLSVPCAVIVLGMGRELRRWGQKLLDQWERYPLRTAALLAAPPAGALLAVMLRAALVT